MDDMSIFQRYSNTEIAVISLFLVPLLLLLLFTSSALFAKELSPQSGTANTYQDVFNAAVQGDAASVKAALSISSSNTDEKSHSLNLMTDIQKQQLTIMLGIINKNTDETIEQLTKFTAEQSDNATALIFAGTAWKQLSKQLSFFSFSKTYEKGLRAHIRAFELTPDNEHYRALAGSSYTQLDSDNKPKQRELLSGYKNPNSGYHLLAQMDMAQNERDHKLLVVLANKAVNTDQTNILVIERAAQAFWTADKVERAQKTFLSACLLPPPEDVFRYTWQNSCYIAGHLALNETKAYQQGIDALTHLLSINTLDTEFNQEAKDMIESLKEKLIKKAEK